MKANKQDSRGREVYSGLNKTNNRMSVIFDDSTLAFREYNEKTGKSGKFVSYKDGMSVIEIHKKIQDGKLRLASPLRKSEVYTAFGVSVVFDEEANRYRSVNAEGKVGKYVKTSLGEIIQRNSENPILADANRTMAQSPVSGFGGLETKSTESIPEKGFYVIDNHNVPASHAINISASRQSSSPVSVRAHNSGRSRLKDLIYSTASFSRNEIMAVITGAAILLGIAGYFAGKYIGAKNELANLKRNHAAYTTSLDSSFGVKPIIEPEYKLSKQKEFDIGLSLQLKGHKSPGIDFTADVNYTPKLLPPAKEIKPVNLVQPPAPKPTVDKLSTGEPSRQNFTHRSDPSFGYVFNKKLNLHVPTNSFGADTTDKTMGMIPTKESQYVYDKATNRLLKRERFEEIQKIKARSRSK